MPNTLAQVELDTGDAIDNYVDEALSHALAFSSGMATDSTNFTELSDEFTDPADKLEFVMEYLEGRYRDMTRRATRLRDEDKQDTDEWANLVKAYAILNQNDVVVAMGDGLQLQAQFSMMKKILEYLYQDNPTAAIIKYVRDLGALTPPTDRRVVPSWASSSTAPTSSRPSTRRSTDHATRPSSTPSSTSRSTSR